jgi:membrane-bound serine protease (ClpP class)
MSEALLDPNLAYLILVVGVLMAVLAILSPGTGLFEVGALILFVLAGWEVSNLPINLWALAVLLLAAILFLLAFRRTTPLLFLGLSILALVFGSAYLFRGESWSQPAVNPILALVVSVLNGGFIWFVTRKALEARRLPLAHGLEELIGLTGEAKTNIHDEGSVQVAGELWSARSEKPITAGARVRVIGREGFILEVEAITH